MNRNGFLRAVLNYFNPVLTNMSHTKVALLSMEEFITALGYETLCFRSGKRWFFEKYVVSFRKDSGKSNTLVVMLLILLLCNTKVFVGLVTVNSCSSNEEYIGQNVGTWRSSSCVKQITKAKLDLPSRAGERL